MSGFVWPKTGKAKKRIETKQNLTIVAAPLGSSREAHRPVSLNSFTVFLYVRAPELTSHSDENSLCQILIIVLDLWIFGLWTLSFGPWNFETVDTFNLLPDFEVWVTIMETGTDFPVAIYSDLS